jgi:hypothetical protein
MVAYPRILEPMVNGAGNDGDGWKRALQHGHSTATRDEEGYEYDVVLAYAVIKENADRHECARASSNLCALNVRIMWERLDVCEPVRPVGRPMRTLPDSGRGCTPGA